MKRPLVIGLLAATLAVSAIVATALLVWPAAVAPARALPPPRFVEEARAGGLVHAYAGEDWTSFVGGGVAVLDCDADGRPDLYFGGGSAPAALFRNASAVGGELRFERLASAATDVDLVTGAYPIDIGGDDVTDLVVLRVGENLILRGLGGCRFESAHELLGVDGGSDWTTAFSATWEAAADLPTLAFGNYARVTDSGTWDGTCADDLVVRPASGDRYGTPFRISPSWCTLSMLFSDWDRSGRRDLRISNDRHYYADTSGGEEQLWRIEPGVAPRPYTRDEGWSRLRLWGMGIASHDLTGDGYPEVFLTSIGDNKLQTLAEGPSRPSYRDIALRSGVTAHIPFTGGDTLASTAWHPEFGDVNDDGLLDLFVAKGNVDRVVDNAARDPSNLFIGQADGTFIEGADVAGIVSFDRARGAALSDLNLDGLLDLVVVNRLENVRLWRNLGPERSTGQAPAHWLAIRLHDAAPNVNAIGAWLEVRTGDRTTTKELTIGGGHAGGQLGWVHFGLGGADRADVRIQWPDGEVGPWQSVATDSFQVIARGAAPRRWEPGT